MAVQEEKKAQPQKKPQESGRSSLDLLKKASPEQTLSAIDRSILNLLKERMHLLEVSPRVSAKSPSSFLSEEESKNFALSFAAESILQTANDLCHFFPIDPPYYHYPPLLKQAMASSPNELPRIVSVGCALSFKESLSILKKVFPAGRNTVYTDEASLCLGLSLGEIHYAAVLLENTEGPNSTVYELIRRNRFFIVASYVFQNGMRVGILSKKLQVLPGSDRLSLTVQIPNEKNALSSFVTNFFSSRFRLLHLETFSSFSKDRLSLRLEVGVERLTDSSLFLLDVLDTNYDSFVFSGLFYEKRFEEEGR